MFSIIGIVLVIGAVIGGYLMEHGNMKVLVQPAELVIIGGAAIGTLLIGNPLPVIIKILKNLTGILSGSKYNKARYLDTLKMLNDLFSQGRKGGMVSLESHVEEPDKSDLFKKHEFIVKDHHALDFICDTMRMALSGTVSPHDLDQMIEVDLEVHHKEIGKPVSALTTVADALPGLGIVAAVLGVVITMGSLGGPPEEIGHKVAAALVGTFLGILLCYGFLSPLASSMTHINEAEAVYYNCLRTGMVAFIRGAAPILAVEFSRRSIPSEVRPSFKEMEGALRGEKAA
ncbi:MAG: flagellar motor stator protein MotA [Acidobacteriaceae bacterium]|nr:flagellar motor stator protein MotA [Acidobacteriaceae bacterium]MBV9037558.1 flagellar motor stator protein MotA [Acidobacteriaceae bacterium]MBV9224475.1 flagellar motor stator protein MotA [Acidobacteriaceae bacterium]MBV9306437.1 flagellar motor stator protein MotA [Acidobacteriaceae bacterium]MBV9677421.1 flagellar motor stator protein MotA [Acidobacteriaceae bacterium]